MLLPALASCGGGGGEDSGATSATKPKSTVNGEKSIEGFGHESGGADRAAVLTAFHGYFDAVADADYVVACTHLSATVKRSLGQIVGQGSTRVSCAASLPELLSPSAAGSARQQASGEVDKVRIQGDKAFVVYHAPGAKLYQLYLLREDGAWRATSLTGSILVPSPATLGG